MDCPLCKLTSAHAVGQTRLAVAVRDGYPVNPGHTLIVPRRHFASWFEASTEERLGWSVMVARLNGLDESRLESFLFGVDRTELATVRPGLLDLQNNRCFYCGCRLGRTADVDHFIPWSRYPDNGIENLVVADRPCNNAKRDFLAAGEHLRRWRDRNREMSCDLAGIAADRKWETHPDETLGVARGIYLRLPRGARLWLNGPDFAPADPVRLLETLA